MIKRAISYQLSAVSILFLLCTFCYAQTLSSSELITKAKQYDGKMITYEGEVIGDVMCRDDYCWANLNDGQAAIGVWMPKSLAKTITYRGSYKYKGDWLEVKGKFNRACRQHAGDLDIHAQQIQKVRMGEKILERPDLRKRNLTISLLGVLCIVLILSRSRTS